MKRYRVIAALALLCLLVAAKAITASIQGYDVLGLAKYCDTYLAAPPLPGVSTLLGTFGDPMPCIEKRIKRGGLTLVQVDLRDATCFRNGKCPAGTPPLTDWNVLRQAAASVNSYAVRYPALEWWISPYLEHDIVDAATLRQAFTVVKAACPSCRLINSPVSGARLPEYPLELHGTKVRAFSVSGDGASIFDGDNMRSDCSKQDAAAGRCRQFQHRNSGQHSTFAWFNELNLRCTGEKDFTYPDQRTNRPTADQFTQAYLVMQPEPALPAVPRQCKRVRDIASGAEINKPNAEAYCNGQQPDPRGNKPLLILRKAGKKGERLPVLSAAGKEVGGFCYYGQYNELPNAHRWYMGGCSGQNPVELYRALGNEWGYVQLSKGECLRFNSIRRQGTYR